MWGGADEMGMGLNILYKSCISETGLPYITDRKYRYITSLFNGSKIHGNYATPVIHV